MSSYFQMKCPDKLSDMPPPLSIVVRWHEQDEVHMDIRYEFIFSDEVFRFRYTPLQNCQWQQINYCLIYVFHQNSHRIRSTFQMKCSTRSTCQMKCSDIPPCFKLSVTGDEVIADLCLQWEPIWNGSGIRSSFQMKWPTRSICQMKCSDIPPNNKMMCTDEHELFRWSVHVSQMYRKYEVLHTEQFM